MSCRGAVGHVGVGWGGMFFPKMFQGWGGWGGGGVGWVM